MRLLRVDGENLQLEFADEQTAKYAILSHRWLADEEEVTFDDVQQGTGREKRGWKKVEACRKQARLDGHRYIWVDTCCIDKSSSQELAETINSMYRIYANADVCYAYLHDMPDPEQAPDYVSLSTLGDLERQAGDTAQNSLEINVIPEGNQSSYQHLMAMDDRESGGIELGQILASNMPQKRLSQLPLRWDNDAFRTSSWFTRGWTLQEMIAPATVQFFSRSWSLIASLDDLADDIADITQVHRELLTQARDIRSYSIAQRMSWAAGRVVKKPEDRAYSLLGIMDVSIGIIYGEGGARAFRRLQEEILRTRSDDSIFAFNHRKDSATPGHVEILTALRESSLLANHPDNFRESRDIAQANTDAVSQHQMVTKEVNFRALVHDKSKGEFRLRWKPGTTRALLLLKCCLESDRTKLIALSLCSYRGSKERFYVPAELPRLEEVDILNLGRWRKPAWKQADLSVATLRDERNAFSPRNMHIYCRSTVKGVFIDFEGPHEFASWDDRNATLIRRVTTEHQIILCNAEFKITAQSGKQSPAVLQIWFWTDDYTIRNLSFKGLRMSLPRFLFWHDHVSIHWYCGRLLLARYRDLDQLGQRDSAALIIEHVGLLFTICLLCGYCASVFFTFFGSLLAVFVSGLMPFFIFMGVPVLVIEYLESKGIINVTSESWRLVHGLSFGLGGCLGFVVLYMGWYVLLHRKGRP